MRKILSLLGALALSTTVSTSVIACSGDNQHILFKEKINLDIINNESIYEDINTNNIYSKLNSNILKSICIFKSLPLKDGYEIKYYSDKACQYDVTNNNQSVGKFYFIITAANDDSNWEGTSKILELSLIKNNLFFITKKNFPSNFTVKSDNTQHSDYTELNWNIINACDKLKNIPLKYGYEIKYYSDEAHQNEITHDDQNSGTIYFTITAANDDPNWEGKTITILELLLT